MSKVIPTDEKTLAALMDELESLIAEEPPKPAEPATEPEKPVASEATFVAPETTPWEIAVAPRGKEVPVPVTVTAIVPPAPGSGTITYDGAYVGSTVPMTTVADTLAPLHTVTEPVAPPPAPAPDPEPAPARKADSTLQFFVDVQQFRKEIAVGETNLDQAMMEQAGMRAYYGALAAQAEAQAATLKAKFEILEARLYDEHEKALVADGKKATAGQIEAAVKRDPRWFAGKSKVIEAESIANVNRGLTFAMADRRDMLIQLGSDRRAEQQGQLRVMTDPSNRAAAVGKSFMEAQK